MAKKVGIITFHNSYNCGSMLESYAIEKHLLNKGIDCEIINFSSDKQKELYSVFLKNTSLRNIIKNIVIFPLSRRIKNNNKLYEQFKNDNMILSKKYNTDDKIDDKYIVTVAGSDQIWNIDIKDSDDNYFLPWAKKSRKVAYAPSFGAKRIENYTTDSSKYYAFLSAFDALSIRENNGQKWLEEFVEKKVPVLIDPTLLLNKEDYELIEDNEYDIPKKDYIFFYCPKFNKEICKLVKSISQKYNLPVIVWSTKSYCLKLGYLYGFNLIKKESPSIYLKMIKNAKLVITTSFHGTIFSTIYRKNFWVIKNGEMYGNDDRVITLVNQLHISDRLIDSTFKEKFNYVKNVNYKEYDKELPKLQKKANDFIDENIGDYYEKGK